MYLKLKKTVALVMHQPKLTYMAPQHSLQMRVKLFLKTVVKESIHYYFQTKNILYDS